MEKGLSQSSIIMLIAMLLAVMIAVIYGVQYFIDPEISITSEGLGDRKIEYEISKLVAEISRIRSDTAGSLFWLKLIALFVTVGGAVGGYLIGQSYTTDKKLSFEHRKDVDAAYQSIVHELSADSQILRAAAAVKLGAILKSFPVEWDVGSKRRRQIIQLTKQIFAAALSIEADQKVRKTITINIALDASDENENLSDLRELDLSGACGSDAYWARCDFFETDFFQADLGATSFRRSSLEYAQFREADLQGAVFDESKCVETNFTSSDLRRATFVDAVLDGANFDQAKVFGVEVRRAKSIKNLKGHLVDCSAEGDGSILVPIEKWIEGSEA
ncbi:pentapeptide repeat-containing protein [Parasedimentitalea psychrophila]|uniref:Pentapeptide repeat-containing protein n=1 Tax=Parasedimentitalea psychrophila TaxID=2997337 RepID=A0A9Y2KYB3_9RHOB|nr:pentapeptide repeat-containing protein [Parasedimentitalea psychrophila]WIY24535.1 pentapeptide repeat-containing protein [Parasedimentitalea psychrophila]